ncbi:tetratricopeptide repeat protein [Emticicia fluvialis]|uniref:tetratricopeptide repeat protein n=1 Tax=Emticicia fluvialis TaxID=2974474 RepID=UPI0021655D77|nr:tetratricopeptide repeat protein [Emticicia fluvialis]
MPVPKPHRFIVRLLATVCLTIPNLLWAQNLKETFDFANQLYEKRDFDGAANTYRRVIFFDKKEEFRKQCYKNIADCLYATQNFEEAADYYELAFYQQKTDSLKAEILFRKLSCFLLTNNFEYAEIELFSLPENLSESQKRRKTFYAAVLHFSTDRYEEAKKEFISLIDSTDLEAKQKIHELFAKNEKISRLNPKTAQTLSMILPGLGQFYAGDVKNGFNSFLLTGGIITWGVLTAINSAARFDVFITMVPWFQRYYMGGYNKAAIIAENQKKKRRAKVYNQLLDVVSK